MKQHFVFQISNGLSKRNILIPATDEREANNIVHKVLEMGSDFKFVFSQWLITNPMHSKQERYNRIQYVVKKKKPKGNFIIEHFL